ncbi:hypothetical protein ANN_23718 [Periplaneta americana]|uniref:Reverse transcriptase domain-containing protein n=1 Tax=Periplaneta americana TaxID=6978 RepID=A0ABQ8SNB3_PERAM|nr:hypothetical protein ANN_23718 [Periplaneta americana]
MLNGRRVRDRRRYQMIDDIKIYGSNEETKRKTENRKDWRNLGPPQRGVCGGLNGDTVENMETNYVFSHDPCGNDESQKEVLDATPKVTTARFPPIIVPMLPKCPNYFQYQRDLEKELGFPIRIIYNQSQGTKFHVSSEEAYNKLKNLFQDKHIGFYTFTPKSHKPLQVVIKKLPVQVTAQQIQEELLMLDFPVIGVRQLTTTRQTTGIVEKFNLPVWVILTDTIHDAYRNSSNCIEDHDLDLQENNELLFLIKAKHKARKNWHETGNPQAKRCYNRLNKALQRKIKSHRIQEFESVVEKITEKLEQLWSLSKKLQGTSKKTSNTAIVDNNGVRYYKPIDKANVVATSLEQRFWPNNTPMNIQFVHNIESQIQNLLSLPVKHDIAQTSSTEVKTTIFESKQKKSPGPDKITTEMSAHLPQLALTHLTKIYNACLQPKYFPRSWKHAHIVTFPKPKKNPTIPNNRRPISLLSIPGKILEKIIARRLLPLLQTPSRTHHQQFGFKKHHSTAYQLKRITTHIKDHFHTDQHTMAVFLDIAQAFDTVWHSGLLHKLQVLTIDDGLIHIIHSFLSDRTFQVKMENKLSAVQNIHSGVPQGSIIAPHLYSVYVHDMPRSANCKLGLYADDTVYYTSDFNVNNAHIKLQTQLNALETWLTNWRVKVNIEKTQAIIFTHRKPKKPECLRLFSENIDYKNEVKYLGVILDKRLRYSEHVEYARNKALARFIHLYPLIRSPYLNLPLKVRLYTSVIRPVSDDIWL